MQKDDMVYLGHMLDTGRLIVRKVTRKSQADFDADEDLRLALTHLVQTFGESARRISAAFQDAHPQIPWKKVIGMRHKVVHDYLHVDYQIVWEVSTVNLPPIVAELEKMVLPNTPAKESS
jgi:uncharacterized protein with HEPN domain